MSYDSEFPDIPIPPAVLVLLEKGGLEDTSWGNDVAPSFEAECAEGTLRLWVHEEDPEERELPSNGRFVVDLLDGVGQYEQTLIETDDIHAALNTIIDAQLDGVGE
jgi:hypothetical protein